MLLGDSSRVANITCAMFLLLLLAGVARLDPAGLLTPLLLLQVLVAIFIADFVSGVVHIWLDYRPVNAAAGFRAMLDYEGNRGTPEYLAMRAAAFRHPSTTLIDKLSYNFKTHHLRPRAINKKSYAQHMLDTVAPATALALAAFLAPAPYALTMLIAAFFIANTQFVHACVHDTHRSRFWKGVIRRLQRLHIVYSLDTHMQHHRYGVSNFCLLTGWANFLMNPLFRLLRHFGVAREEHWSTARTRSREPG